MDISGLSSLLEESRRASEVRPEAFQQKPVATAPVTVINRRSANYDSSDFQNKPTDTKQETSNADTMAIWTEEEILTDDALLAQPGDMRPAPRYEFFYRQSVGTEDTMLGLSDKTPLTSDCSHLIVKIHFPGATMRDLSLDVKPRRIYATSHTHRLFTYLPISVDEANGTAAFDTRKEVLSITLPIIHEFPF